MYQIRDQCLDTGNGKYATQGWWQYGDEYYFLWAWDKLIALASFLVTKTLAARVSEICRNPAILFLRTKRTFLYIPAYFATLQNALSNMS